MGTFQRNDEPPGWQGLVAGKGEAARKGDLSYGAWRYLAVTSLVQFTFVIAAG